MSNVAEKEFNQINVKERKPRVLAGVALEADVMKRLARQLERLPTIQARLRMADFVAKAAAEGKVDVVAKVQNNGQLGFGIPE